MSVRRLSFVTLAFALFSRVAFAQAAAGPTALQSFLLEMVLPIVAYVAKALLVALVIVATHYLKARFKVQATQGQIDLLDSLAEKAVTYAEEKAAAAIKQSGPLASSSSVKLNLAVGFLQQQMVANGVPQKLEQYAADYIHAKLGATPGVGASATPAAA